MRTNNKGTDQSEQMHRLVCIHVVCMQLIRFFGFEAQTYGHHTDTGADIDALMWDSVYQY